MECKHIWFRLEKFQQYHHLLLLFNPTVLRYHHYKFFLFISLSLCLLYHKILIASNFAGLDLVMFPVYVLAPVNVSVIVSNYCHHYYIHFLAMVMILHHQLLNFVVMLTSEQLCPNDEIWV